MAATMAPDPDLVLRKQAHTILPDDPQSPLRGVPYVRRIAEHQKIAFLGDPAGRVGMGCAGLYGATQTDVALEKVEERCGLWCDRVGYMTDSVRDFVNANPSNAFEARKTVDGCLDFMARHTALEGVENIFDAKGL